MESDTQRPPQTFSNHPSHKPNMDSPFPPFTNAPMTPPSTPPESHYFPQPGTDSTPTSSMPSPKSTPPRSDSPKPTATKPSHSNVYPHTAAAVGILYCPKCDRGFGNKLHFQRHFMFAPKHRDEDRSSQAFYYRLWNHSWRREDGHEEEDEEKRFEEVDHEEDVRPEPQMGPEPEAEPEMMEDVRATPEREFE